MTFTAIFCLQSGNRIVIDSFEKQTFPVQSILGKTDFHILNIFKSI